MLFREWALATGRTNFLITTVQLLTVKEDIFGRPRQLGKEAREKEWRGDD